MVLVPNSVLVRGEGVATCCCVHLLKRAGLTFALERGSRPKLPAIMVGEQTQRMIGDVFDRPGLFTTTTRITKRVVMWGDNARKLVLPHSAAVISEQALLDRIQLDAQASGSATASIPAWTIYSSRPLPEHSQEHHFGSRFAEARKVTLRAGSEVDACWIESLYSGWLFLLPDGERGWLLSVGGPADQLLGESRLVAEQIEAYEASIGQFPAHPRVAEPLCEPHWIACGTAALGFDPLCGDGAGNATREAILACAVVGAIIKGEDEPSALEHYRARLQAGFRRHLAVTRDFYRSGGHGPWWGEQAEAAGRGIEWCGAHLENISSFRYQLRGFTLEARES